MRVLAIFCFAFAAAVFVYTSALPLGIRVGLMVVSLGLLVVGFSRRSHTGERLWGSRRGKILVLTALGFLVGALWCGGYEALHLAPLRELEGKTAVISLRAAEDGNGKESREPILCRSGSERVLVYLDDGVQQLRLGDELQLRAELHAVDPREDISRISKDITLIAYQRRELKLNRQGLKWWELPKGVYSLLQIRIGQMFPADTEPFLRALLTGDTGKLAYGLRNDMSLAGISHVVAVSGMHVNLLCSLVMLLCLRRRRFAAGFCLATIWFFAGMLGFTPSVTRAVVMNSLLLLAPLFRREYDAPTSLSFALVLLLLPNPHGIRSVGLQLSFASVAGILCFSQPLYHWFKSLYSKKRWHGSVERFLQLLAGSASTTLGASILTIPLCAYYFGTVSLIAPLSNLILLPMLSVIFTVSYPLVLLSFCIYPVAAFAGRLLAWPVRAVLWGIELLGDVPFGSLYTHSPYVILWLAASYGIFALAYYGRKPGIGLICILAMLVTVPIFQRISTDPLRFTMLDVGQGQCLLAEAGKAVIVIDCGGSRDEEAGEEAARTLLSRSRGSIDALILTHYDRDHVGGTLQLMERMKIGCLYLPDIEPDNAWRQRVVHRARELEIPISYVLQSMKLHFQGGTLDIFAPIGTNTENDGLSLLLSEGDYDILISGDLSAEEERQLLLREAMPDIEVLVAGHHGAKTSTSPQLLQYCRPELLLISVGPNSYGHPTQEVLKRAERVGAKVYRTDEEGTILLTR